MGQRNISGVQLQCSHCGYEWFYQGAKDVTSCPYCGWRVKTGFARQTTPTRNVLLTERKRDRLI